MRLPGHPLAELQPVCQQAAAEQEDGEPWPLLRLNSHRVQALPQAVNARVGELQAGRCGGKRGARGAAYAGRMGMARSATAARMPRERHQLQQGARSWCDTAQTASGKASICSGGIEQTGCEPA